MADNVAVTAGAGTNIATDERTINSTTVHVQRTGEIGGTAMANGQVTISSTAATIAAARETRKSLLIINRNTVAIWVGIATVTTANGVRLEPGDSIVLTTTALVQGITAAAYSVVGDANVQYIETYDS
jgi:hypothetical protein